MAKKYISEEFIKGVLRAKVWSMDDEIKYLESRDKVYRNLALIILAIALGATLRYFLSL